MVHCTDVECSMDLSQVAPTPARSCPRLRSENTSASNSLFPTTGAVGVRRLVPPDSAYGNGERHMRPTIQGRSGGAQGKLDSSEELGASIALDLDGQLLVDLWVGCFRSGGRLEPPGSVIRP